MACSGAAIPVQAGDCFVLCSDGLSNYLEGDELARILQARFYRDIPRLLVDLANDRGGDDNVTVVVIHAANDASLPDGATPMNGTAAPGDGDDDDD